MLMGTEKTGLFPALLEKHGDLAVYETVLGSRLLLGGTSPLIKCPGLVLSKEVNTMQAATQKVWVPELVINVNKVKHLGSKKNLRTTSLMQKPWG